MNELLEQFFDVLSELVDHELPWAEKSELIEEYATENGYETIWEEFLGWFEDEA